MSRGADSVNLILSARLTTRETAPQPDRRRLNVTEVIRVDKGTAPAYRLEVIASVVGATSTTMSRQEYGHCTQIVAGTDSQKWRVEISLKFRATPRKERRCILPENPGVGGSIPSLPTIHSR